MRPDAHQPGSFIVGMDRLKNARIVDNRCENSHMRIDLKSALSSLPLLATTTWPEGVWDKTVFSHGTMSVLVFTPRGRDYQIG